jgi:rhodanese-related sulfurtransferase
MRKLLIVYILWLVPFYAYGSGVSHIDNAKLAQLIEHGVPVIDVRATSEWKETGVIKGSYLMMFYDEKGKYNLDAWLNELSAVTMKDEPLILICRTGGRSHQLARYLTKVAGYKDVYNVKRGIIHWITQNNPIIAPK